MKFNNSVLLWFVRSLVLNNNICSLIFFKYLFSNLSEYLVEVLEGGVAASESEGVLVTRGEGEVVSHEGQVPRPLLRLGPPVSSWTRRHPVTVSVNIVNIE